MRAWLENSWTQLCMCEIRPIRCLQISSDICMHPSPSLYIYNLMQHDIGHVMHDAGSDKCWVALTVGTTCGPGRHKSCQKLCRVRFPQVRPRLTESVGIHWKHLYRALITYTMDPEFGCDML